MRSSVAKVVCLTALCLCPISYSLPVLADTTVTDNKSDTKVSTSDTVSKDSLLLDLVKAKLAKGDTSGAITDLTSLIQNSPTNELYYAERASAYFTKKSYNKSLEDVATCLKLKPKDQWALDLRGRIKSVTGDLQGAADDFTTAISFGTRSHFSAIVYYNRAFVRQTQKKLRAAIDDLSAAIEIDPKYAKAYAARGFAESNSKDADLDKALADYDKSIELDPNRSLPYVNRSLIKNIRNDNQGALADLDKAIQVDPADVIAYRNRGKIKELLGDSDGAIADYSKAISLSGGNPDASTAKASLPASSSATTKLTPEQDKLVTRYMQGLQLWIKSFWYSPKSNVTKRASVLFSVSPKGEVSDITIKDSSGNDAFDAAAKAALEKSAPVPIPPKFMEFPIRIQFTFDYNVFKK